VPTTELTPNLRYRVHIQLDYGRGINTWQERWQRGEVFEQWPYGYQWAARWVELSYSLDHAEPRAGAYVRRAITRLLGFDLVHAWRNRRAIAEAHVVWTHTEREHLALALLKRGRVLPPRVRVIGQSVWLWDRWPHISPLRRFFYRWLLSVVEVHTTHSRQNATIGERQLGRRVYAVPYGTHQLTMLGSHAAPDSDRVRVVAPGNDAHRDWSTLAAAARQDPRLVITVLSKRAPRQIFDGLANVTIQAAGSAEEVLRAYANADVVAVPLRPNHHASGITVALEALNLGRPLVVSRTGGIDQYLGSHATYVQPENAEALAAALRDAATGFSDESRTAGRCRVTQAGLTDRDYADRHVLLTWALIDSTPPPEAVEALRPARTAVESHER
jgi:glycosyltransferase involved in cell wall biosynthesis